MNFLRNLLITKIVLISWSIEVTGTNWGPWTDWSSCSKTCGHGVAYRQRVCHLKNSEPEIKCEGNKKQYKTCKTQNCPDNALPEGVKECRDLNAKVYGGKTFQWKPFRNPYKRCELSCKADGHHYYRHLPTILNDGTPCNNNNNKSYCLSGLCLSVGCDGIIGSNSKKDRCGICNGNGNTCQVISGIFTRFQLDKYNYNHVIKIPRGACNINITEMAKSRNYLAIKLSNGKYIINGNIQLRRTGTFNGAGTEFRYYKNTGPSCPGECIYSTGPTNHSIDVEVLYYHRNPGIIYHFTIPNDQVGELNLPSPTSSKYHHNRNNRNHSRRGRHKSNRNRHHHETNGHPLPEEQKDQFVSNRQADDRYIIRRRIDADRFHPRIQFGQSPTYIPNTRYQQQSLGSRNSRYHGNQLNSRYATGRRGSDSGYLSGGRDSATLGGQSVVSRTGQYIIPSSRSSYLTLTDHNNRYQPNTVLQTHDRNLIDKSGLYSWRISGFTECSRSCGGGTQETRILCMKGSSNVEVTPENCDPSTKPQVQSVDCNKSPCPSAEWFTGNWSSCSVSCGEGIKNRLVECRRRISPTLQISVSASLCLDSPKPTRTRRCSNDPCAIWKTGNWSRCSVKCGHGQRRRDIQCVNINGKQTDDDECSRHKPKTVELCDMGSCAEGWYHTRWSEECSAHCGRGFYTRKIFCAADDGSSLPDKKCPIAKKPKTKKSCKSSQPCGGNWFTGPWSKCNATCGTGVIERGVVCMKKLKSEVYTIVKDVNCLLDDKPESVKACDELPPCEPTWYMTEYSQCSKSCGTGVKRREVKCLNAALEPDMTCDKGKRPATRQSCNKESCERANYSLQKDSDGKTDGECTDKYPNWCQFVHQSRICGYKYYQKQCCKSCQKYL